jgi:hypothetical protein
MSGTTATQSSLPSTSELVEGILFYPIACVVSATIFPGFTLCIPGLLLVTALVLIPLAAIAIVALVAAAVVAAPFLLVRGVRALCERRAVSRRLPRLLQPVKIIRSS